MNHRKAILLRAFGILSLYASSTEAQEFVPGSDDINEQQILRHIENEIGLGEASPALPQNERPIEQTTANLQDQRAHTITVRTVEGNQEIAGITHIFQEKLFLRDISGEGTRQINIVDIRRLTIKSWNPSIAFEIKANEYSVLFIPYTCTVETNNSPPLEGIIDGENWIQIVIRDNGEKRPIPLSYYVQIEAASREEALSIARKTQGNAPAGQYSSIAFKEAQINEVSSKNKQ